MKFFLKAVRIFILVLTGALLGAFLWLTLTEFNPPAKEELKLIRKSGQLSPESLTLMNWNLGYSGVGEDMDFFLDGGSRVKARREEYMKNWQGITSFIRDNPADLFFFQETDRFSHRSFKRDQYREISDLFNSYDSAFAVNHKVKFVPGPGLFHEVYGSVHAGLSVFSAYKIERAERISLPGEFSWPFSLFYPKRGLLVSRLKTETGRELVLINIHNSAYDTGSYLKAEQLDFIRDFATEEFEKGAHVIIGGDWNMFLPGTHRDSFSYTQEFPPYYYPLPEDWSIEGWTWAVDTGTPSNRSLKMPYKKGETYTAVIDGFLLSPGIGLKEVHTIDLGFKYSDHNPQILKIEIP